MLDWDFENKNGDVCFFTESETASFRMDSPVYGQFELALNGRENGAVRVHSLFASFGDFSESLALRERRKTHVAENGCEVALDSVNPVPFGTEPKVERTFRFNGKSLHVQTTFSMRHSFQMRSVNAGGLVFSGKIGKIGITAADQKTELIDADTVSDGKIIFDDACPPLRLSVLADNGSGLEFEAGETVWRWINAARIGGSSRYTVTKDGDTFRFNWQLYTFQPETEESVPPEGRDWRIQYAVHCIGGKEAEDPENFKAVFDAGNISCFSAAPALNTLKKWVRRQFAEVQSGDVFAVINADVHVCCNAAHMGRAKQKTLLHWDKPAWDDFARWANRQFARYGATLVIKGKSI